MKRFLAIYTGTQAAMASWNAMPERERKEREAAGIKAWHAWADRNKASIVELGAPLGRTKSVSKTGLADIRNNMTAFTVVQAETHEAAAKLFEHHPHFTIFPGDAIEVMECLPVPSM
jgi:hypothetical protein